MPSNKNLVPGQNSGCSLVCSDPSVPQGQCWCAQHSSPGATEVSRAAPQPAAEVINAMGRITARGTEGTARG